MFLFDSPVKAFLGYIRDQKVPADLIDVLTESGVRFFEGCLLVDVHDHRSHAAASESILGPRELHGMSAAGQARATGAQAIDSQSGLASSLFYLQEGGRYGARKMVGGAASFDPRTGGLGGVEIYRIVLHPTSETLWADIKMLDDMAGGMWSDQEALEVEAKILALTAPPLCLTPDPQATRIANLMLSSTALPSAYNPSHDSPYRSAKKRGANSIEMEKEEANRQRREKIMRLMQHGHKSVLPPQVGMANSLARPGPAMVETGGSTSAAAATAFVPTFDRMTFIERWRIGRNAALNGGMPAVPPAGAATNATNSAASGSNAKGGKDAAKPNDKDDVTDTANNSTAKKPTYKKKKKAQREKEEAEAAAAAEAEAAKKKAEEEAAAAAAAAVAAKKPKKKLTKKEREEKERKEKEEKEKAEKEEKQRKEKEAAAANGKPSKPKSKKKQKEEAAAAAAAASAEAASKSLAKNAPGSPDKDKKATPKKTAAKKPAAATAAASTAKKKTTAKSEKKSNNVTAANATAATSSANGVTETPTMPHAVVQGTPILGSATPSVQSTPTPAHRSIPSQPQQQQQMQQQQMQQQLTQQQLQQAALAGMFPNMANQLPFGAGVSQPGVAGIGAGGFGMPMMNGGFPPTSNPQITAAALAAMQGMGIGQFGAAGAGNFGNAAQMQQMMQMMNAGGMVGFNGMPFAQQMQQSAQGQQAQGQQQQQAAPGQGADMPVGVGLAGLANWGTGK